MADADRFFQRYSAYWGPHPSIDEPETRQHWIEWLSSIRNEGELDQVLKQVSEARGNRMGKPRLDEFQRALRVVREGRQDDHGPHCGLCRGSGWLSFSALVNRKPRRYTMVPNDTPGAVSCAIPCRCSIGNAIVKGSPHSFDERLRSAVFEMAKSKGGSREDLLTWREYLDTIQDPAECKRAESVLARRVNRTLTAGGENEEEPF